MDIQFERFDLCDLDIGINIAIIGLLIDNSMLRRNMSHIFSTKLKDNEFKTLVINENFGQIKRYNYIHKKQLKEFNIITLYPKKWKLINLNSYDVIFIHSLYKYKNAIINKCGFINDFIDYSSLDDFFVIQKGTIKICAPEYTSTYSEIYNKNPFCYNDIIKLSENINNSFSFYHAKDGCLHNELKTRLKELDIIYFTIFCFSNRKDITVWLPTELNLEIMKLLYLSIKNEI